MGVGGLLVKGADAWLAYRKNKKSGDTTLAIAEKSEEARRLMRVEAQANNLYKELREVEKENLQLQLKASTLEFRLDEALKREKEKDTQILALRAAIDAREK